MDDLATFHEAIRKQARQRIDASRSLVDAVRSDSVTAFMKAIASIDECYVWREAMLKVARGPGVSPRLRDAMLQVWIEYGDHIRQETGDDLLLASALRNLMPSYEGPAITLYRGEGWQNRCRRTYGLSWTPRRDVAEGFAEARRGMYEAGTCVIATEAQPEAIVSAPGHHDDRFDESEFLVDRRRLKGVRVIERRE